MKTVITAMEDKALAQFDKRFGRAEWFCVYNEETNTTEFIKNNNVDATNGAGVKAAEKMVELEVQKIISGDFGPKAKELLDKFSIQMVIVNDSDITIEEIISKLKSKN
jgi:predicted Fe-Mo cluster-binding NifX family protein